MNIWTHVYTYIYIYSIFIHGYTYLYVDGCVYIYGSVIMIL